MSTQRNKLGPKPLFKKGSILNPTKNVRKINQNGGIVKTKEKEYVNPITGAVVKTKKTKIGSKKEKQIERVRKNVFSGAEVKVKIKKDPKFGRVRDVQRTLK